MNIDSKTYHQDIEHRSENLKLKVKKYSMDKIRSNTQLACDPVSKGYNYNWDRIEYKLPRLCIIHAYPVVLPLSVIDDRWRFKHDEGKHITAI